jgi:hypothetical protein
MTSPSVITSTRLSAMELTTFTKDLFGVRFLWLDSFAHDIATGLSEDIGDDDWLGFTLTNGGFYMAPAEPAEVHVSAANGLCINVLADAFGITCWLRAYLLLSGSPDDDFAAKCRRHYALLWDFAWQHPERSISFDVFD